MSRVIEVIAARLFGVKLDFTRAESTIRNIVEELNVLALAQMYSVLTGSDTVCTLMHDGTTK